MHWTAIVKLRTSSPLTVAATALSRRGKSFAPIIAVLVIVSGVAAGALIRAKQSAAPETVPLDTPTAASTSGGSDVTPKGPEVTLLDRRAEFSLATLDIDDTVEAPSIAVSASGIVYVAWATKTGESERALMMSRSEDGGKTWVEAWKVLNSPIHVAVSEMRGRRIERRLHLLPLIATHREKLYLSWVRGGEERSEVAMLLATSDDQGRTFSESIRVHENDQARPTFTSMAVSRDGDVACSWLDNRNDVQQCFMAVKPYNQEKFLTEMLVDPGQNQKGICPCCPTNVAFAPDQSVWVAYRGHVDGMRDMWMARWQPGSAKPSAPMRTNQPTWKFDGCPHDGPSLLPLENRTTIAWMDAHQGMSRVFVNQLTPVNEDSTSDWTQASATPLDASFAGTQEQPCLAIDPSSAVIHAAWSATESHAALAETNAPVQSVATNGPPARDQAAQGHAAHGHSSQPGSRRAIHFASSFDGGKTFSPSLALAPLDDAFQSRVKLAVAPEGHVYTAYFELSSEGKRLVVGRVQPVTQQPKANGSIAGVTP
jgi:hypothetical protein